MKKISIIFSFFNEEENIDELIKRTVNVLEKLKSYDYELIFVNDCSTDNSIEKIKNNSFTKKIKIINMKRNEGRDECVIVGFKNSSGDLISYLDADLQDPPELLNEMIKLYESNNSEDTIIHSIRKKREEENILKLFSTRLAYKIINLLSVINLPTECGDFKLFTRKALKKCLSYDVSEMTYLRGLPFYFGYNQHFVYYNRKPRYTGPSKFPILLSAGPAKTFSKAIYCFTNVPKYLKVIFVTLNIALISVLVGGLFNLFNIKINIVFFTIFIMIYTIIFYLNYLLFKKKNNLRKVFEIDKIINLNSLFN